MSEEPLLFMVVSNMSSEKLIAFLIVFSQILQPAKNITTAYFSIQKGMASIDRIDQILDAEEKIMEKKDALPVSAFNDSIRIQRNLVRLQ